jgi:hypothetical protein
MCGHANIGTGIPILILAPITWILPLLLGPILVLVICANWYPVLWYGTSNGPKKYTNMCTDPHKCKDISITGNGNLRVLLPTCIYIFSLGSYLRMLYESSEVRNVQRWNVVCKGSENELVAEHESELKVLVMPRPISWIVFRLGIGAV